MLTFADAFLQPEPGTVTRWPADMDSAVAGTWSLEIPLRPWSADDEMDPDSYRPGSDGPELIQTSIMLGFISLPADRLNRLSGRFVTFPANPRPGFAEGTLYLAACHCPININSIAFGTIADDRITADLDLTFDFARAGGIDIDNRDADLHVVLRLTTPGELRAAFQHSSR